MSFPKASATTATFPIVGMDCDSCAKNIERVVKKLPGVVSASVSYAAERATVTFEPARVTAPDIAARVKALGYTAVIEALAEREHKHADQVGLGQAHDHAAMLRQRDLSVLKRKMWFGGVVSQYLCGDADGKFFSEIGLQMPDTGASRHQVVEKFSWILADR